MAAFFFTTNVNMDIRTKFSHYFTQLSMQIMG